MAKKKKKKELKGPSKGGKKSSIPREDSGKFEQSKEDESLAARLDAMREASEDYLEENDYYSLWKLIDEYYTGRHWEGQATSKKGEAFPAIQMSWKVTDAIHAKIFNQPLRPTVVAEEQTNFPVDDEHPWRAAVLEMAKPVIDPKTGQPAVRPVIGEDGQPQMQPVVGPNGQPIVGPDGQPQMQPVMEPVLETPFQGETDNEIAAEALTASLDFSWEKNELDVTFEEAGRMAEAFGTAYIHTSWDEEDMIFGREQGLRVEIIHPAKAGFDPANITLNVENCRWFYIDQPMTLGELIQMFPDKEKELISHFSSAKKSAASSKGSDKKKNSRVSKSGIKDDDYQDISGIGKMLQSGDLEIFYIKDRTMEDSELEGGEKTPLPKYVAGWMKVYKLGKLILKKIELDESHGQLPITPVRCYNVPGRFLGMGVMEQTLGLNIAADRHLKYAIENARKTSQNKVIVNEYGIDNFEEAVKNTVGGIIRVKVDKDDIRNFVIPLPAQDLPAAHVQLIDLCRDIAADITGERDMLAEENLPKDASGKFVEAVQSANNARVTRIRKNIVRAIRRVSKQIVFLLIENEDEDRQLMISRDWTNPSYISFNPHMLSFDDDEFEAKWDIQIEESGSIPLNPIDANTVKMSMMKEVMTFPGEIQDDVLDIIELNGKAGFRKTLRKLRKIQSEAGPPPNPDLEKIAAEKDKIGFEAMIRTAQSLAENIGDALEKQANQASVIDPSAATAAIQELPLKVKAALEAAGLSMLLGPVNQPQQPQQ